jgi:hypothetical protein
MMHDREYVVVSDGKLGPAGEPPAHHHRRVAALADELR